MLSIGRNPLGGVGLQLLLNSLSDLKVTSLNVSRTTVSKAKGDGGLAVVLRDQDTIDFFGKVCTPLLANKPQECSHPCTASAKLFLHKHPPGKVRSFDRSETHRPAI